MFHFTGYREPSPILFREGRRRITTARLPHSEISGSKRMCRSPKLIAACHVLHRLLAPRHSLCALHSLIPCLVGSKSTAAGLATRLRYMEIFSFSQPRPALVARAGVFVAVNLALQVSNIIVQGPQKRSCCRLPALPVLPPWGVFRRDAKTLFFPARHAAFFPCGWWRLWWPGS